MNDRENDVFVVFVNTALCLALGPYCTFRSVTTRTPSCGHRGMVSGRPANPAVGSPRPRRLSPSGAELEWCGARRARRVWGRLRTLGAHGRSDLARGGAVVPGGVTSRDACPRRIL